MILMMMHPVRGKMHGCGCCCTVLTVHLLMRSYCYCCWWRIRKNRREREYWKERENEREREREYWREKERERGMKRKREWKILKSEEEPNELLRRENEIEIRKKKKTGERKEEWWFEMRWAREAEEKERERERVNVKRAESNFNLRASIYLSSFSLSLWRGTEFSSSKFWREKILFNLGEKRERERVRKRETETERERDISIHVDVC